MNGMTTSSSSSIDVPREENTLPNLDMDSSPRYHTFLLSESTDHIEIPSIALKIWKGIHKTARASGVAVAGGAPCGSQPVKSPSNSPVVCVVRIFSSHVLYVVRCTPTLHHITGLVGAKQVIYVEQICMYDIII